MKDSTRVWLSNRVSYFARNKDIAVVSDLAGGIAGSYLWSRTLKWTDMIGGTVRMAQPSMLTEPWNPIAGTSDIYDQMIIRGISDYATLPDPNTGLPWPQNVAKAEVFVEKGQPSFLTLEQGKDFGGLTGWVTLSFVPEIVVPGDAWADWDAATQTFIPAKERFGGPVTARSKVVVTYPSAVFDRAWHDGSKMTIGDMVLAFIMSFDRAKLESAIYDAAAEPAFKTFMGHFKGLVIVKTSPEVVFEVYSDLVYLDAELTAADRARYLWPAYGYGVAPWHTLALGRRAEAAGELAFSSAKAKKLGVEWMCYVAGPSLEILTDYLTQNAGAGYVPYAPTLGKYITADEAKARYANLTTWYADRGHLYVSNGPLYLDTVDPVGKRVVLRRFAGFTDPSTKWDVFAEPKIAVVKPTGPATIKRGTAADITVNITFNGAPYPLAQLAFVKYLLFDGVGNIVATGVGTPVKDGQYVVRLTGAQTKGLAVCVRIARGAYGYAEKIGSPRLDEVPLVGLHGSNRPTEYRSEQHLLGTIDFALRTAGIRVPKARVPQVRGPHGFSHRLLAGACKVEVVVASKVVGMPTFASFSFLAP